MFWTLAEVVAAWGLNWSEVDPVHVRPVHVTVCQLIKRDSILRGRRSPSGGSERIGDLGCARSCCLPRALSPTAGGTTVWCGLSSLELVKTLMKPRQGNLITQSCSETPAEYNSAMLGNGIVGKLGKNNSQSCLHVWSRKEGA